MQTKLNRLLPCMKIHYGLLISSKLQLDLFTSWDYDSAGISYFNLVNCETAYLVPALDSFQNEIAASSHRKREINSTFWQNLVAKQIHTSKSLKNENKKTFIQLLLRDLAGLPSLCNGRKLLPSAGSQPFYNLMPRIHFLKNNYR